MKIFSWADSMAGRVFLLLLVGVVAAASLAFTTAGMARRRSEQHERLQRLAERVVDLKTVLDALPAGLSLPPFGAEPEAPRLITVMTPSGDPDLALTDQLKGRLPSEAHVAASRLPDDGCGPRPAAPLGVPGDATPPPQPPPPPVQPFSAPRPPPPDCRLVKLTLNSGRQVAFILPIGPRAPPIEAPPMTPLYLAVLAIAAAVLAYIVARVATAPIARLSKAATGLGRDLDRPALAIEGPAEVRLAASAFNAMQAQLKTQLQDRTQMLAAITHDLQTPMTRQRLRLEKVSDPELREQLLADQSAMQELIHDGLELARMASEGEPLSELDIDSLLQALRDDAVAAGHAVTIGGDPGLTVWTRPHALRRCISNLLDNALKYASEAELSVSRDETVAIRVLDRGPGIPATMLDAVLQPFYRLETSRSRETGGVGLGLTIARTMADRSAADLLLQNRPGGGLEAVVRFGRS